MERPTRIREVNEKEKYKNLFAATRFFLSFLFYAVIMTIIFMILLQTEFILHPLTQNLRF